MTESRRRPWCARPPERGRGRGPGRHGRPAPSHPGPQQARSRGCPPRSGPLRPSGPDHLHDRRRGAKLVRVERRRPSRPARRQLAAIDGVDHGAPTGPARSRSRTDARAGDALESHVPRRARGPARDRFVAERRDPGPLPANDADIAFAPVTQLSRWIETRKLSSERLTSIYLERIARLDPKLRSRHHADPGSRARAGEAGRRRNRRRAGIAGRCTEFHTA